jgi:DNA-binding NarL/FixJ family response regulator
MRVAIAEDDEPYRLGLVELLTAADVTVACQAISGRELLDYLEQGDRPDAVLLDIQMEGRRDDGVTTAEEIFELWPAQGVLLLSNHENDDLIRRFFAGGTARRGYLLKENFNDIEDVRHALDLVRRAKTFSDTAILDRFHRRQLTIRELLTPREQEVLQLVAAAFSNAAIAASLRISEEKVENTTQSIYNKLGRSQDRNPRVNAAVRWLQEMAENG